MQTKDKTTYIIGHRGLPKHFPENTALSITQAIEHGVNAVEFDIQCSKSGTPWVFHDKSLNRLTGQSGLIFEHTDEQLAQLSAHYPERFGDQFAGTPICTLAHMVDVLMPYPNVDVFIEAKTESLEFIGVSTLMDSILNITKPLGARRYIISFHANALAYVTDTLPTVWVVEDLSEHTHAIAKSLKPTLLCASKALLHKGLPHWHNTLHSDWLVYSADDEATLKHFQAMNITRIETNDIAGIKPYL